MEVFRVVGDLKEVEELKVVGELRVVEVVSLPVGVVGLPVEAVGLPAEAVVLPVEAVVLPAEVIMEAEVVVGLPLLSVCYHKLIKLILTSPKTTCL